MSNTVPFTDMPSERNFGILFVFIFAGLGFFGIYKEWSDVSITSCFVASFCMGGLAIFIPTALSPFNRAWFQFGELLGKIVSPIVLGVIFFGLLTPVGMVARLFGRDELRLKPRAASSYWVERKPAGPASDSFNNQF